MLLILLGTLVGTQSGVKVAFALTTVQPAVSVDAEIALAQAVGNVTVEGAVTANTVVK